MPILSKAEIGDQAFKATICRPLMHSVVDPYFKKRIQIRIQLLLADPDPDPMDRA